MEPESIAAVAAAGAAIAAAGMSLVALPFTIRAANAAKAQTDLQRRIAEDAAQPYIWVDIEGDRQQGQMLELILGNAGPTLATDVRVNISPDLPPGNLSFEARDIVTKRLNPGLRSLAPGRLVRWPIGMGKDVLSDEGHQVFTITIDACGPFGPIPTFKYEIDLADFRESSDSPEGSLHLVRKSIDDLAARLDKE